jgi:uncharacterized protein YndB with AHSA1/START domain
MTPIPKPNQTHHVPGCETTYEITGRKEIVFERTYDAPAARVFRAFSDAKRVGDWWGSPGATLQVDAWDVRTGGSWRITETMPDGKKATFSGAFNLVEVPTRIETQLMYGTGMMARKFAIKETYEFIESNGKTLLRLIAHYPMGMALKGMLATGMDQPGKYTDGSRHQWRLDRLGGLLA